jgi:hypothetical protein
VKDKDTGIGKSEGGKKEVKCVIQGQVTGILVVKRGKGQTVRLIENRDGTWI